MKTNRKKLELAMARACMSTADLQKATGMPRINNAISGRGIRPCTMGRIAKALGADVAEIIDDINE